MGRLIKTNLRFKYWSCPMLIIVMIILSADSLKCSWFNNDEDTTSIPWPKISAHSPAWSPDGLKILFAYAPLTKVDDTTYILDPDSGGWWFIEPSGNNLLYFGHLPGGGDWDWHPNGDTVLTYIGWGYPSLIKVCLNDTSITEVGYFEYGAGNGRYSSDGKKIVLGADKGNQEGIWIMDANGNNARLLLPNIYGIFDWSTDGGTIAYEDLSGGLWVCDTNGANKRQLLEGKGLYSSPTFSPNGAKIAFDLRQDVQKDYEIYVINIDGSGLKKLVTGRCPAWSPNGSKISFMKFSYWGNYDEGNGQLWIMDSDGTNQQQLTFVR